MKKKTYKSMFKWSLIAFAVSFSVYIFTNSFPLNPGYKGYSRSIAGLHDISVLGMWASGLVFVAGIIVSDVIKGRERGHKR